MNKKVRILTPSKTIENLPVNKITKTRIELEQELIEKLKDPLYCLEVVEDALEQEFGNDYSNEIKGIRDYLKTRSDLDE